MRVIRGDGCPGWRLPGIRLKVVTYPDSAAKTLLRVINQAPEAVINALGRTYLPPVRASPDRCS